MIPFPDGHQSSIVDRPQTVLGKPVRAFTIEAHFNQRIRVVRLGADDPTAVAPRGEEGEIIADLAGDEAFEGYWRRPDADAKAPPPTPDIAASTMRPDCPTRSSRTSVSGTLTITR